MELLGQKGLPCLPDLLTECQWLTGSQSGRNECARHKKARLVATRNPAPPLLLAWASASGLGLIAPRGVRLGCNGKERGVDREGSSEETTCKSRDLRVGGAAREKEPGEGRRRGRDGGTTDEGCEESLRRT